MDWLHQIVSEETLYYFETFIQDWGMTISIGILLLELIVIAFKKQFTMRLLGDAFANFGTLALFFAIGYILVGAAYVAGFYWVYLNFSITQLPINGWVIMACVLLADIAYYWEHRFMHRCGIGWATHTVHHSSPYFNISVAYRFGPLDGIMPFFFHLPLAFLGFNPIVIVFAEGFVQLYQTLLHTEVVKKLPKPIEWIFNTPSHHRVHHGSNPEYIDKNYAGIFIIWDKLFGTFAQEENKVIYGITTPVNTVNPIKVFFIGLVRLAKQVSKTQGFINKVGVIVMPPGWSPKKAG
ncbi:sterol desaturase family protein [Alteromonadaceae bacterium M269]|nr:sterol desaturase family protein [Alteromonadaceae bacterium M269]